nr:SWIM zinc finger family protein [uncultured Caproiciproducens sp.]
MKFGNWDSLVHEDFDQLKRIAFSQRIKSENITLDAEHESAEIVGTDGIYEVNLCDCTCYDFQTRQLPCKHIYRLASELGFLSELPKISRKAEKAFNGSIPEEIERYKRLYLDGAISLEKLNKIVNALHSK